MIITGISFVCLPFVLQIFLFEQVVGILSQIQLTRLSPHITQTWIGVIFSGLLARNKMFLSFFSLECIL